MKIMMYCLLLINFPLMAADFKSPKSEKLAQQLVRSINQILTEIAEQEIAAGAAPEDIAIYLNQLEKYDSGRFGAILDNNRLGKIVSITPKSPASLLGLKSGDVLLTVNGNQVSQADDTWRNNLQYAQDKTPVEITLNRNGTDLALKGQFSAKFTPSWELISNSELITNSASFAAQIPYFDNDKKSFTLPTESENRHPDDNLNPNLGCGRVFVYNNEDLDYRTDALIRIDDKKVPRGKTRHKLSVGSHKLELRSVFPSNKYFYTINIAKNSVYHIGFVNHGNWLDEKGNKMLPDDYVGPAVIKVTTQQCQL